MSFFKFKPIIFSIIPLLFLSGAALINGLTFLYPWGIVLAFIYYSYLQSNIDLDFSFSFSRKVQVLGFFSLSLLPLAQFAFDSYGLWPVLTLWPMIYGVFHSLHDSGKTIREQKIIVTMFLLELVSYFFIRNFIHEEKLLNVVIETIMLSTMFLPYFLFVKALEVQRLDLLRRKSLAMDKNDLAQIDPAKEQKYFYHDLINKTHGMSLFASEKIRTQNIDLNDMILLQKEIQALQTIIKDHAEIKHRNLAPVREWVSYLEFRPRIRQLMSTYFSHRSVHMSENYPKIDTDLQHFYLHAPSFERTLGNLFKNAFEASSERVEIFIMISDKELVFEIRNDLKNKNGNSFQLADKLSRDILRSQTDDAPLGLESIHFLVSRMNGKFYFGHDNGIWVSRVTIPNAGHLYHKQAKAA